MSLRWEPILERAAEIVRSYEAGVTLRQLFYRLVAAEILPNTPVAYKTLSARTGNPCGLSLINLVGACLVRSCTRLRPEET